MLSGMWFSFFLLLEVSEKSSQRIRGQSIEAKRPSDLLYIRYEDNMERDEHDERKEHEEYIKIYTSVCRSGKSEGFKKMKHISVCCFSREMNFSNR